TLGVARKYSGLSDHMVCLVTKGNLSPLLLLIAFVITSITISNFMSNTSAANLVIPIVASLSVFSPLVGSMAVAIACSFAMSLPISTPPNAIAFATEQITTRDMAKYGTIISLIGLTLLLILIVIVSNYL
ncbi:MAG: dihydroorotate dehydrogenase, partial [Calditrichaeota bacterium]